ncbi:apolipoprotein N-acyltransferase [Streptomyces sp. C10-9-1]|uniref:apolipoprotein N-acyltransferase n=1 Tax=Streptomyces sp. C10-9-1 TaxID=1859285 RepID=UPI002111F675|nr:apolipoprotein N-acyltransferase [Streptomyces sp. C10-9-1]MCQ6555031.1 apolipoprotein N-acyltransferase [Streptomyces sp. C10-9-1]
MRKPHVPRGPFASRRPSSRPAGRGGRAGRRSGDRTAWARAAGAVAAGALPALAFPEPSLWWFAFVALVPWMLLLRTAGSPRRALAEGWLGGIGFMVAVHHWLFPSLHVFLLVLAALMGLLWAPWGWLVRSVAGGPPTARRALAALVLVPSGWLAIELVRSWEGLGGPWGLLGASQWQVGPALRIASVGGVWLVGLLVVAVNTAVALLVAVPRVRVPVVAAAVAGAAAVAAVSAWAPVPRVGGGLRVLVVQPGVVAGPDSVERRFDRGERLTLGALERGAAPGLVVWGESSVGADLRDRPDLADRLAALARRAGAPLLVNVDARGAGPTGGAAGIHKSAVLVGPEGPTGDRYDKMRLVPFGEYVPARWLLGWATSVGRAAGEDRLRGDSPVVMTLPDGPDAGARIGPLVCFESAFPDMSRRLVRDGAGLLVAQSSTSSFQGSWAPGQHASLAALRAAESGRPVVHATLTGVSAVFGPTGRPVGAPLGTGTVGTAVYEVPGATGTTLFVRFGEWPVYGALAVLAVAAASAARVRLRSAPGRAARRPRTARASAGRPAR